MPVTREKPSVESGKWGDLRVRILSGAALAVLGAGALFLGGVWFHIAAIFVTAVVLWELWTMIDPARPTHAMLVTVLSATVLSGLLTVSPGWGVALLLVVPVLGAAVIGRERALYFFYALGILAAGWGLIVFRDDFGGLWVLWLVLVVIATDIFGYFAGRMLGGPKFWPKVSPKKTWSGTIAGWITAGIVGLIFMIFTAAGPMIIVLSVLLSFASQLGDIAESALKRRLKVKDSSTLIPGHGGLFDRFDGLLGAALFMIVLASAMDISGAAF